MTNLISDLKTAGYYERSFGIIVTLRVQEAKESELLEQIKIAVPATRKEKGCIQYDFSRDLKEPVYTLYEHWENGAALEAHLGFDYTKNLLAKMGEVGSDTTVRLTSLIL